MNKKKTILIASNVLLIICLMIICLLKNNTSTITTSINNKLSANAYSPSVIFVDNIASTTANKGTKIKVSSIFVYFGEDTYYYKPEMFYSNGKRIYSGNCNEVNTSKVVNFSFYPTKEPIYARITIYNDNTCSNSIKKYDSKKYSLTASNNNGNNNNNGNSNNNGNNNNNNDNTKAKLSIIQPTQTHYTKNTVVTIKFKHNGQGRMYYKFTNYNKLEAGYKQECSPIDNNGVIKSFGLTIDKNNTYRYSIIKLYSDSTCNTLVDLKTTKIYRYLDSSSNNGNNNNNNNNNNHNNNQGNGEYTSSSRAINPIKTIGKVKNVTLKMEKGCNESVINKYIADLKQNPSYFIKTPTIYFVSEKSIKKNWGDSYAGITSGVMSLITIEVVCDTYYENTVPHELAHAYDSYKFPNYYSNNAKFLAIYNKNMFDSNVLTSYGRGNLQEFFAEAYVYYFRTYITKEPNRLYGYGKKYPAELKNYVEKALSDAINQK